MCMNVKYNQPQVCACRYGQAGEKSMSALQLRHEADFLPKIKGEVGEDLPLHFRVVYERLPFDARVLDLHHTELEDGEASTMRQGPLTSCPVNLVNELLVLVTDHLDDTSHTFDGWWKRGQDCECFESSG